MRSAKRILADVKRCLPRLSRREWGMLAIEAAREAGLCEPDVASLRTNLQNEWAAQRRQSGVVP